MKHYVRILKLAEKLAHDDISLDDYMGDLGQHCITRTQANASLPTVWSIDRSQQPRDESIIHLGSRPVRMTVIAGKPLSTPQKPQNMP